MSDPSRSGRAPRRRSRRELLGSLSLFSSLSCAERRGAEEVAANFVRTYYVQHDSAAAMALTVGGARARLEREAGASEATDPDSRPIIVTRSIGSRPDGPDRALVTYELEVKPRVGRPFVRKATLEVVREQGAWRVASFSEE